MIDVLKGVLKDVQELRKQIKGTKFVDAAAKKSEAERIASVWFSDTRPALVSLDISEETLATFDKPFEQLLKLSGGKNRTTSYEKSLDAISRDFRTKIILPVQKKPKGIKEASPLNDLLAALTDPAESEYLKEASKCAQNGFYRAAAVLGWSAAIDRIHRTIDSTGLAKFNAASVSLAAQQKGRFKKFNKVQNVTSISDLRSVFDDTVLWIIEGMGLIDVNEHHRLAACLLLRNQAAHPGDAPITNWNLLSFFSDLKEIVFDNPDFASASPAGASTV